MAAFRRLAASDELDFQEDAFWSAVTTFCERQQAINRRLLSSLKIYDAPETAVAALPEMLASASLPFELPAEWLQQLAGALQAQNGDDCEVDISVYRRMSRAEHITPSYHELVLCDKHACIATLAVVLDPAVASTSASGAGDGAAAAEATASGSPSSAVPLAYQFARQAVVDASDDALSDNQSATLVLNSLALPGTESPADAAQFMEWLGTHALPKLAKWAASYTPDWDKDKLRSLQLVDSHEYAVLYTDMKQRIGLDLVKKWPEKTDPQKFVYEDVAIAAYLILLWRKEREENPGMAKQSFVDLGCGNGLLVYILNQEGHPGYGIDLRRRKIWDSVFQETRLEEQSLVPSVQTAFPGADWLLGNHSDELTPWMAVFAAATSFHCRYFVLPCCFHDFAFKFRGNDQRLGQYHTYLEFVREVGERCGFVVEMDRLCIPSTKRICLVGRTRTYPETDEPTMAEQRAALVAERHGADFVARPSKQVQRNATRLAPELRQAIISAVVTALLEVDDSHVVELDHAPERSPDNTGDGEFGPPAEKPNAWRTGGEIPLGDMAERLGRSMLQRLKSECGGLQTLLRNQFQVFDVHGGTVRLRDWSKKENMVARPGKKQKQKPAKPAARPSQSKRRLCWHYMFHPDGCPQPRELCTFAHGPEDLVTGDAQNPASA